MRPQGRVWEFEAGKGGMSELEARHTAFPSTCDMRLHNVRDQDDKAAEPAPARIRRVQGCQVQQEARPSTGTAAS